MEFQTAPSEPTKDTPSEPIKETEPQDNSVEPGKDVTKAPSSEILFKDAMTDAVKTALNYNGLPDTEENRMQIINLLSKSLKDIIPTLKLEKKETKKVAEESIEDALSRRGLESNAANYKKVIQILLGE